MKIPFQKIAIVVLVLIVLGLLARYVVFKDAVDEWGAGLERVGTWQEEYRRENPGATDEEVDAAFRAGMANITVWQERYMRENPDATKEEMNAAFEAQFEAAR